MIKIASVESMRRIEAAADAAGLSYAQMMENAGRATAERALALLAGRERPQVTILVGPGNNGGDGLVAGRVIAQESDALVRFYLLRKRSEDDVNLKAARDLGLLVADAEDDQRYRVLHHLIGSAHLLIDALFGIGIRLPLQGEAARMLQAVQHSLNELRSLEPETRTITPNLPDASQRTAAPFILAVDCPSGVDCDSGALDHLALAANETVTYIAAKPGLLTFPGAGHAGSLTVSTIGVPPELAELKAEKWWLVDGEDARTRLPARPPNSHKGTFGRALIIAGSPHYIGAAGLAAQGAYRAGAGLVTAAAPQQVVAALAGRLLETTWLPLASETALTQIIEIIPLCSAVLIGPGWGRERQTRDLLLGMLRQCPQPCPPLIIDADGLNLLADVDHWWSLLPPQTVITPHPGEMARLCGLDTTTVQADRWSIAAQKAAEWNLTVMLKGAHTLITSPDGRLAALPFKTDALAKAGTGDVLAGMIVGLMAQGASPIDAAVAGGYIHGLAGERAAQWLGSTRSVTASDVLEAVGQAFQLVERREVLQP